MRRRPKETEKGLKAGRGKGKREQESSESEEESPDDSNNIGDL
jgi:hypothetical protein